jgi:hypothetical protein
MTCPKCGGPVTVMGRFTYLESGKRGFSYFCTNLKCRKGYIVQTHNE